jgi:5'-nucleotidase
VRALVTNDDGIDSRGIAELAGVAVRAGLDVLVAAPHTERSGTSASLGAMREDGKVLFEESPLEGLDGVRALAVEATPAFIAWAGVRGAFGFEPDIVLSGINKGPNAGRAILHSGTVGAAFTANAHGLDALAVSQNAAEPQHWATAAAMAERTLAWLLKSDHEEPTVVNLNVPDVPAEELRGLRAAPLASFGAVQADIAEIGEGFLTVTYSEVDATREPHTDAGLGSIGWATVTALQWPCESRHPSFDDLVDE